MREKLHTGELYLPTDETIVAEQTACLELLYDFNQTRPREQKSAVNYYKKCLARSDQIAISNHLFMLILEVNIVTLVIISTLILI